MEKFLAFWSHNNAVIIEVLVALILISTIFLVYRIFFGAKGADTSGEIGVNTVQIEKTLQKILDQQGTGAIGATASGAPPLELLSELSDMKKTLEEKEQQIVILQEKAAAATKAAQNSSSPSADAIAAAAQAAAGLAEKERTDYEAKIKELEARLAEYEIISEDIADLSFFKEENQRLTKEIETLRSGGGQGGEGAVDDALMAEFAKAVESQKAGEPQASAAGAPGGDESKKSENDQLLAEFENFNKKS